MVHAEGGFLFSQDTDGRWLAESRLLPGCAYRGATREEAARGMREAESAWARHARPRRAEAVADRSPRSAS